MPTARAAATVAALPERRTAGVCTSISALRRSVTPAVSDSGGGCLTTRKVPCLCSTSTCESPFPSRQNRSVAVRAGRGADRARSTSGSHGRQHGIDDERVERRDRLQAEERVDQQRERAGVPQLRRVGARIRAGTSALAARVAADALRDAVLGIQLAPGRTAPARAPARARRSRIGAGRTRSSPSPPPTPCRGDSSAGCRTRALDESVRMPQPLNMSGANSRPTTRGRCSSLDDAAGEAVADVRGDGADRPLVGIERQGDRTLARRPTSRG